jgi:hypothetical protein
MMSCGPGMLAVRMALGFTRRMARIFRTSGGQRSQTLPVMLAIIGSFRFWDRRYLESQDGRFDLTYRPGHPRRLLDVTS